METSTFGKEIKKWIETWKWKITYNLCVEY